LLKGEKNCIQGFGGKHLEEVTLKTGCRQENNLEMDLQDTGTEGVNWFHMAKDREKCQAVVNKVMNLQLP
jgi:hypothetical protein